MPYYQTRLNYKNHNFNTAVIAINDHIAKSVDSITASHQVDECTAFTVADGTGIINEDPATAGIIQLGILEASPTSDILWTLQQNKEFFKFSHTDSSIPKLLTQASFCRIVKSVDVGKVKEHAVIVWSFTSVYLSLKGGSYALAAAA